MNSDYIPGESLGFLIERNPDNTLNVFFSDNICIEFFEEEDVDLVIGEHEPDLNKVQVFSEEELHTLSAEDSQCH